MGHGGSGVGESYKETDARELTDPEVFSPSSSRRASFSRVFLLICSELASMSRVPRRESAFSSERWEYQC